MNQRKRVQLEGGGGRGRDVPACPRAVRDVQRGVRRARSPRAALTRLAERSAREVWRRRTPRPRPKNNAAPEPRPARGRAGKHARLGGARGRGVARGAAAGQSFDACRASGCRHGTSECHTSRRRRVMDVA